MSTLDAILLGIIQGITEFLPVSSSGHLKLTQFLFGFENLDQLIFFDLICHLGTLLSIIFIFYREIGHALMTDRKQLTQVILGTLPLFPLVFLLKPIKALFNAPQYLGFFFLLTALMLFLGIRLRNVIKWQKHEAILIGMFQAIAILPGISRSGATISAARMVGWSQQKAITFSFLLAIPAILGGIVLESFQLFKEPEKLAFLNFEHYAAGFFTSFIMGSLALLLLLRLAMQEKLIYFVWYCLLLGCLTIFYFNFL